MTIQQFTFVTIYKFLFSAWVIYIFTTSQIADWRKSVVKNFFDVELPFSAELFNVLSFLVNRNKKQLKIDVFVICSFSRRVGLDRIAHMHTGNSTVLFHACIREKIPIPTYRSILVEN